MQGSGRVVLGMGLSKKTSSFGKIHGLGLMLCFVCCLRLGMSFVCLRFEITRESRIRILLSRSVPSLV
jgi:hypothetical protein